jgi:hypothetical protein
MPRSVLVLGQNAEFFEDVRRALAADARFDDVGDLIHCDGSTVPLTNIYAVQMDPVEWEGWDPATGVPDPRTRSTLVLECRSAHWVAEIGEILARSLAVPIWFVDGADRAWPADKIDAERIALA